MKLAQNKWIDRAENVHIPQKNNTQHSIISKEFEYRVCNFEYNDALMTPRVMRISLLEHQRN